MSTYARTHVKAGITALSVAVFGAFAFLSPLSIQATWPFNAAHAAAGDAPVLHDSSTLQLLAAALNVNPDPSQGDTGLTLSDGSALMAVSGPDGSSTDQTDSSDASDSSTDNSISVYTVQNGDSISGIASHFGVSVNTILWANDLTTHSTITPGMTLNILPVSGVEHTVRKGETLNSIATAYHASASEIATFNGLDANATVVVGDELVIPGGEVESVPTPAKSTSSTKTTSPTKSKAKASSPKKDLGQASSGGYFRNPVPGAILTQGIHGKNAVDLGAPSGTPIHAAAAGRVIISNGDGAWNGGYGSYVVISHANGMQTLYAHMSRDIATVGESVSQGEVIGYVGETGEATGNHLHFEVRSGRNPFGYSCTLDRACY